MSGPPPRASQAPIGIISTIGNYAFQRPQSQIVEVHEQNSRYEVIVGKLDNLQTFTGTKIDKLQVTTESKLDNMEHRLENKIDRLEANITDKIENLQTTTNTLKDLVRFNYCKVFSVAMAILLLVILVILASLHLANIGFTKS